MQAFGDCLFADLPRLRPAFLHAARIRKPALTVRSATSERHPRMEAADEQAVLQSCLAILRAPREPDPEFSTL